MSKKGRYCLKPLNYDAGKKTLTVDASDMNPEDIVELVKKFGCSITTRSNVLLDKKSKK